LGKRGQVSGFRFQGRRGRRPKTGGREQVSGKRERQSSVNSHQWKSRGQGREEQKVISEQ